MKKDKLKESKMAEQLKTAAYFIERDFQKEEVVLIGNDVYSLTIAANITKNCSPTQLIACIRQCTLVFCIQSIISIAYMH